MRAHTAHVTQSEKSKDFFEELSTVASPSRMIQGLIQVSLIIFYSCTIKLNKWHPFMKRKKELLFSFLRLKKKVQKKPPDRRLLQILKNWFMLSVRISSYGCTREVWSAREKRKSRSRHS